MTSAFHSPAGADPGRRGGRITGYYNLKPGVALKKRAIRRAAAVLFAERGYHGCGLDRIAEAARLNRGALAYYFASREDLLYDVLAEHVMAISQHVYAAFDAGVAAGLAPAARLEALVQAILEAVLAERFAHRAMLVNVHCLPDDRQHAVKLRYRVLLDSFGEVLGEAVPGLSERPGAADDAGQHHRRRGRLGQGHRRHGHQAPDQADGRGDQQLRGTGTLGGDQGLSPCPGF